MTIKSRQQGFTLIEILVAMVLILIIMVTVYPAMSGLIRFGQKEKTSSRLATLKNVVTQYYAENAMLIDSTPQAVLTTYNTIAANQANGTYALTNGSGYTADTPPDPEAVPPAQALGTGSSHALTILSEFSGTSLDKLLTDGFGRYFAFFVSDELTANYSGPSSQPLHYHVIAIVSANGHHTICGNGYFYGSDSSQATCTPSKIFNPATGQLNCPEGDQCAVVSGLPIERQLYQESLIKLRRIARSYSAFFTSRYLSNTDRSPSVDYFSEPDPGDMANAQLFDSSSPVCNSGNGNTNINACTGDQWSADGDPYPGLPGTLITRTGQTLQDCQPATALGGFTASLGLSSTAVTSSWGYPFAVCNGPNATGQGVVVRNPASNTPTAQQPPYTAVIAAWLPGGGILQVPVIGQY